MIHARPVGCREAAEVDSLIRALANLRHWAIATQARANRRDDRGKRLHTTATRLREQAWADALLAAYRLFEIDGLHQGWCDAEGRRH